MCLAAGLRQDPLGSMQRFPRSPSWMKEMDKEGGYGKGGGKGQGWERRGSCKDEPPTAVSYARYWIIPDICFQSNHSASSVRRDRSLADSCVRRGLPRLTELRAVLGDVVGQSLICGRRRRRRRPCVRRSSAMKYLVVAVELRCWGFVRSSGCDGRKTM